jgi:hypothetical protein
MDAGAGEPQLAPFFPGSPPPSGDRCELDRGFRGRFEALAGFVFVSMVALLGIWQVHHFQFSSGFDLFPGPRGDTRLTAYLLEHCYQFLLGHGELLSPGMFYPVRGTLGLTDIYLAYLPLYSFFRVSNYDIFLALALTVICFNCLNFISCFFLLARILRFNVLASSAGAAFFAFNNPKLAQTDHLQLQPLFLLPIITALLIRFFWQDRRISAKRAFGLLALAAFALDVQLLTSFYVGWFFLFWSLLLSVSICCLARTRSYVITVLRRYWLAATGGAIVFVLGFLPFLMVYLPAVHSVGWFGYYTDYIPEIKSYLLTADGNYIWGSLTDFILRTSPGPDWGRRISLGLVPSIAWIAISVFAIRTLRKYAKISGAVPYVDADTRFGYLFFGHMVLATNLLFILGLQYRGHSTWRLVYSFFPGAGSIRAVARLVIVMALPVAIGLGAGVQCCARMIASGTTRFSRCYSAAAVFSLFAFGFCEQFNNSDGRYYSISAENGRLARLAAKLPADCASFYVAAGPRAPANLPSFQNQNYMHDAMLVSILRGIPTLNGRSGKNPPGWSLRDVRGSDYEGNVAQWIRDNDIQGNVCRLEIDV